MNRFRVALSFPGEHRSRVENIALALANRLGQDRVLYDRFHAAEFNRPNLDVYLPRLYCEESDLISVFLCNEYNVKEWCGLEWRACRDVLKHRRDEQLMFFRLDDSEIPGLYSIDGYQDMRNMPDDQVVAAILSRLGETPREIRRSFTSKLPVMNSTLVGRDDEIAFLERAWADPETNLVQIIASGGTGKTALVDKWFRRHLGTATIFGWSFHSQGASNGQTSSDPFFADFVRFFHIDVKFKDSVYIKAEAMARVLRENRVLLILDGIESLQHPGGPIRDEGLRALLQELAAGHAGLAVCTTRIEIDIPQAVPIHLDDLTPDHGAEYLRIVGIQGSSEELQCASREYGNNALALTLLGTYLTGFHDHRVRPRVEIRGLLSGVGKDLRDARRMISAYEQMLAGKPEHSILTALGYFDQPAEREVLKLLMPDISDRKYRAALTWLYKARLVLSNNPEDPVDCHALVREHFAAAATPDGHLKLYKHFKKQAPGAPETLTSMLPLCRAVYHGCQAGRHTEVLCFQYFRRIQRDDYYLSKQLGALGTHLRLLANFFEDPWTKPITTLSKLDQCLLLNDAGWSLRANGRLIDALSPLRAARDGFVELKSWFNAARCCVNITELHLVLGETAEAVAAGREAVDFADRSERWRERVLTRATLAHAMHQVGNRVDAHKLFSEAEQLQSTKLRGKSLIQPILGSIWNYYLCDLLLDEGTCTEVVARASQCLKTDRIEGSLLERGLDHLSLGRAYPSGSIEAARHLDKAVSLLEHQGSNEFIASALLARCTSDDLNRVFRLATRSGMRLHLADYHLACHDVLAAERLINQTGYGRRKLALEMLRTQPVD